MIAAAHTVDVEALKRTHPVERVFAGYGIARQLAEGARWPESPCSRTIARLGTYKYI